MEFLFFLCVLFAIAYSANGQMACTTPDGGSGICRSINECPILINFVRKASLNPALIEQLRKYSCEPGTINVCCPDCYTPDGKEGVCKPATQCTHILNLLRSNSQNDFHFVKHSQCYGRNDISICCGPPPTMSLRTGSCNGQMSAFPPSPDSDCCGVEATSKSRIFGGNDTEIDQYPWLVLLEYKRGNKIRLSCGGALISGKYVVTAAHCVKDPRRVLKPINVRVGEYDTENDGSDCKNGDCTDPAISVPIEEIIPHPDYNFVTKWNDIALIRLKEAVNFTEFVRPICLPSINIDESLFSTMPNSFVAGWGKTEESSHSRYKQHVDVPLIGMQTCQTNYNRNIAVKPNLWTRQLCAGGEQGKDSCNGDSGGPLMRKAVIEGKNIFELIGVVSFGPRLCGTENVPGVYTKVNEYTSWIRSHIKP